MEIDNINTEDEDSKRPAKETGNGPKTDHQPVTSPAATGKTVTFEMSPSIQRTLCQDQLQK
jgi:hypothetical protein